MKRQELAEATKKRLLDLLRPADDVPWSACAQGILDAVGGASDQIAALAYVFQEKPWACWSGPETPLADYPTPLDGTPTSADSRVYEAFIRDGKAERQFRALVAQIEADDPVPAERALRAWTFINRVDSRVGRVGTLQAMLTHRAFVSPVTPFRETLRYNDAIPEEVYFAIIWRHRDIMGRLFGIATSEVIRTSTAGAAAILTTIAEIPDERERAVVFGAYCKMRDWRSDPILVI